MLAPPWSLPLIARMPEVARGIEMPLGHGDLGLGVRRRIGLRLRAEGYSQAIVLPRSLKAALVPWFARIPRRTGFRGEWRYGLLNDVRELDRASRPNGQAVRRRSASIAAEPPPFTLPRDLDPRLGVDAANLDRLMREHGLSDGAPVAALMPGAEYGPAKRWPARELRRARGRARRRAERT